MVIGIECSIRPATNWRPVFDSQSSALANELVPSPREISDSCRCQPEEKKFGRPGRHMKLASRPRRWHICLTADRNSTTASAAASPPIGLKLNSIWPGPHSSSIERGSSPTAANPSLIASSVPETLSRRTSERYW